MSALCQQFFGLTGIGRKARKSRRANTIALRLSVVEDRTGIVRGVPDIDPLQIAAGHVARPLPVGSDPLQIAADRMAGR